MSAPTLRVRTQLQYDYSAQKTHSLGTGAIDADIYQETSLKVYFVDGNDVSSLKRSSRPWVDADPEWIVESTSFPEGKTPKTLHTIIINSNIDVVIVVVEEQEIWMLRSDDNRWKNISKPDVSNKFELVNARPFVDVDDKLVVTVLVRAKDGTETNIYYWQPTNETWTIEKGLDASDLLLAEFIPGPVFGETFIDAKYGYLVCGKDISPAQGKDPGIAIVSGGVTTVPAPHLVAVGDYHSLTYVKLPTFGVPPLVFAVSASGSAYCFSRISRTGTPTYKQTKIFGSFQIKNIQVAIRKNIKGDQRYKIEVCALAEGKQIVHLVSEPFDDASLFDGDNYSYPKWRDFIPVVPTGADAFLLTSLDGFSAMIVSSDRNLAKVVQDERGLTWAYDEINIPSPDFVKKRNAYYVEVSVEDANRTPVIGATFKIGSNDYVDFIVNGHATIITGDSWHQGVTNGFGKITMTIHTYGSLAAPLLKVWVEGMPEDKVANILPTQDIRTKFKTITGQNLRDATNNITGKPLINPSVKLDTLNGVATGLQELMGAFSSDTTLDVPDASSSHPSAVGFHLDGSAARFRSVHGPTTDHIGSDGECHFSLQRVTRDGENHVVYTKLPLDHKYETLDEDKRLDVDWSDISLAIRNTVYNFSSVVVQKVGGVVSIILNFVADGVNRFWQGVVDLARQAFDAATALFAWVGCKFVDLFGWLACLFDVKQIKATAKIFKDQLDGFYNIMGQWIDNVVRPLDGDKTDEFLEKCEAQLVNTFSQAKTKMDGETIGQYDKSGGSSSANGQLDEEMSIIKIFNDLPSTFLWLQNKIIGDTGSPAEVKFDRPLNSIRGLFDTLRSSLSSMYDDETGDFKRAAQAVMDLLYTFADRGTIDGTKLTSLFDAIQGLMSAIIKHVGKLVKCVGDVAKEAIKFFDEILDIDFCKTGLGSIFESIFGESLTLKNAICYLIAIPFTAMHKIITGDYPSETEVAVAEGEEVELQASRSPGVSQLAKKPRSMILWRAILAAIHTVPDTLLDAMALGGPMKARGERWPVIPVVARQILNGLGLIVPIIDWFLTDPRKLIKGTWAQKAAVSVPAFIINMSITWFVVESFKAGPRGSELGMVMLTGSGIVMLSAAVWNLCTTDTPAPLIVGQFVRPLSSTVKAARFFVQKAKNPASVKIGLVVMVVDIVSGYGSAGAWLYAHLNPPSAQLLLEG
ncbi:hypothetical protein FA15DRAFT_669471 [Coprinopsis marcescibilis]|uniref:Uncharacterized protein n=1 Tax=Coprinopsis marcescibilis TaxID=230819 RepID=A0A5C3KWP0_COPMA|nr:hypothetical protein FA15DRAFT_669471 [Coprinopsis marcescibilis]